MHDCHTHSVYSEDVDKEKGSSIDAMAARALELGIKSIAITDHLEIDKVVYPDYTLLDSAGIRKDVLAAKEKYAGKVNVIYGVELAQMAHHPEITKKWLDEYKYEYIIGSTHTLRGCPDFSCVDFFEGHTDEELRNYWYMYLDEMREMLDIGGFDVLAHITYPTRYYKLLGKSHLVDIDNKGKEYFEDILKTIIEKNIALEINTSGLRQDLGITLPGRELAKFYFELGGRELSLGSDAHYSEYIGCGIRDGYEMCRDLGFKYVMVIENGEKKHYSLEKELEQ